MVLLFVLAGQSALAWTVIVFCLGVRSGRARTQREILRGTAPVLTRQLPTCEIPLDVRRAIEDAPVERRAV